MKAMYNSREEFEKKNQYLCVFFESMPGNNSSIPVATKSFSAKKLAENYIIKNGLWNNIVMTRKKFDKLFIH